jgi:hypothetical protein
MTDTTTTTMLTDSTDRHKILWQSTFCHKENFNFQTDVIIKMMVKNEYAMVDLCSTFCDNCRSCGNIC